MMQSKKKKIIVFVLLTATSSAMSLNAIEVIQSLGQRGKPCLPLFYGSSGSNGPNGWRTDDQGALFETADIPIMVAEGRDNIQPESISSAVLGSQYLCMALVVIKEDTEAINGAHDVLKHHHLSVLVILDGTTEPMGKLEFEDDTIILTTPRENIQGFLFCPGQRPSQYTPGSFTKDFLCPRGMEGQDLAVNYFDYKPFFYITDNPKEPAGICMDALRILGEKKQARVSFTLSTTFMAFDETTGTWHLGCVSGCAI